MVDWYAIEGRYLDNSVTGIALPVGLVRGKRRAELIVKKLAWEFRRNDFSLRPIDEIEAVVVTDEVAKVLGRGYGDRCTAARIVAKWDGKLPHDADDSPGETSKDGPWSEPDTPSRWAKRFKMSWDTLKRRFDDGSIRHKKLSPKSYRIHVDDLPPQ